MPMIWRFVDKPELAAAVLLDMNDGMRFKTLGGEFFKLPSPPLERSIATNNLTDGGLLTNTTAGLRELPFTVELTDPTESGRIAQLDALKRELSKPSNLIMYQPAAGSFPVFFRTLRSDLYEPDQQFIPGVAWRIECSVLAEPYAIGLRHDITVAAVVNNDPAAATNPCRLDITGVRGDSPAPALARVTGGAAGTIYQVAQRAGNNPTALTVFAQAEAGTLGTDTTVQANDATMSGAGSNFVRTTFSTDNNLTTRVTVSVPTASSGEAIRGRYRVLVKVRRSANTSLFTMRYQTVGANFASGPLTTYAAAQPNTYVIDLGIVEFPTPGSAPVTIGYSGLTAAYTAPSIAIQAKRATGALNLDIDYAYLLPADERQFSWKIGATIETTVLDGPNDLQYGMPSAASLFGSTRTVSNLGSLVPRQGGLLYLVPGTTNRIHAIRAADDVTVTSTWDFSYWPRWREVATS